MFEKLEMNIFEKYYKNVVKYDLLQKFKYKSSTKIPEIKSITLNIGCKTSDFKKLTLSFLSLQLLTKKKGKILISKKSNILLKIRKGDPVGCEIILRKKSMFKMLSYIIYIISQFKQSYFKKVKQTKNIVFCFKNPLFFNVLEQNYSFFNNLDKINIIINTNASNDKELIFLLSSLKIIKIFVLVAQSVEYNLAKINVVSSNLI